jgi:hypothetical protein
MLTGGAATAQLVFGRKGIPAVDNVTNSAGFTARSAIVMYGSSRFPWSASGFCSALSFGAPATFGGWLGFTWLTGGSVGPEASVFTPIILLIVGVLVGRVYRENKYHPLTSE